jgi:hypothetical protein
MPRGEVSNCIAPTAIGHCRFPIVEKYFVQPFDVVDIYNPSPDMNEQYGQGRHNDSISHLLADVAVGSQLWVGHVPDLFP